MTNEEYTQQHVTPGLSYSCSNIDLLITFRKGKHTYTSHSFCSFCLLFSLLSSYSIFISFMDLHSDSRNPFYLMVERCHGGNDGSIVEWDVGSCFSFSGKQAVGCRWMYNIKLNLDGSYACLKEQVVAKGYSHFYSVDHQDTFSPIVKWLQYGYLFRRLQLIIGGCIS